MTPLYTAQPQWMGLFKVPSPKSSAGMQLHDPGVPLPSLAPPAWPMQGYDPRPTQPGYAPGNQSDGFTGFCFLQLGPTTVANEKDISFGSNLTEKKSKGAGKEVVPQPFVLTLAPSLDDLIGLNVTAPGTINLYYRVEYVFDAQYPNYIEGSCDRAAGGDNGYKPLSQRGVKVQLRNWAVRIWVKAVGAAHATAVTWNRPVRFDAFLSPGSLPAGASGNKDTRKLTDPSEYLPTFSHTANVPSPSAGALTFRFRDLARNVLIVYPTGAGDVPIPPDAVVWDGGPGLYGNLTLY